MVVHPNKPILFSVNHSDKAVQKGKDRFREIIKGRSFLFIELSSERVAEILMGKRASRGSQIRAYQRLVIIANRAGLKVVGLDSQKNVEAMRRVSDNISSAHDPPELYLFYKKRENEWLRKLEGLTSKAVIVMNPVHSTEIAKKLRIPNENIIGKLDVSETIRKIVERETREIEKARFERKKRKAENRAKRQPRK